MREHQLERIMYDFIDGDIDVLVSTTIIETGLDISNVNTMIIHDTEDNWGLLSYRAWGRVGRMNRMAYAFSFMGETGFYGRSGQRRRRRFGNLIWMGSKIAMRDLEIRGAGNLLGEAQHGHMEAVGYNLSVKC